MKNLFLIATLLFTTNLKSQTVDTVKNAIQVQPYPFNSIKKDTVFQVTWSLFNINRNDTTPATSYVQLYDRKANLIYQENYNVPFQIYQYLNHNLIDNYILTLLGITKKE